MGVVTERFDAVTDPKYSISLSFKQVGFHHNVNHITNCLPTSTVNTLGAKVSNYSIYLWRCILTTVLGFTSIKTHLNPCSCTFTHSSHALSQYLSTFS